ncbi:hypothetical protein L0337_29910 [candidate division KSB1 bacterium]|nr:hypothetical protein [candidate division KSB1 bacterium]
MYQVRLLAGALAVAVVILSGCQNDNSIGTPGAQGIEASSRSASLLKVSRTQVWADCKLFDSVVTPAHFNPQSEPFDQLYMGGFKDGIGLISDAKPGDQDYNGGRWHVNVLRSGVDPAKYATACNVEDLDPADFEGTQEYFECPLLPRRN